MSAPSLRVSLRQLHAFIQVAEAGSFVAAAASLHVTPAALSVLIRSLEEELGFVLFERTTRKVALSAAGQQYLPYAQRVLTDMEHAARMAYDLRSGVAGVVRVTSTQGITSAVLPQLFAAFNRRYPDVRLIPLDTGVNEITAAVDRGDAEFAIAPHYGIETVGDLELTSLFSSGLHLVCAPSHPFARKRKVAWSSLVQQTIIYTGRDVGLHAIIEPILHPSMSSLTVNNLTTALGLISIGTGVTVFTNYTRPLMRIHDLCMVPLVQPVVNRQVALYKHRTRPLLPVALAFESFAKEFCRTQAGILFTA